ncbi:MAG: hypothetical protein SVX38_15090 [Chloroflexota bacterium]|nr:hypothetical protein [Chloroflexota bacterium]
MRRFISKFTVALIVAMLPGSAGIVALIHELSRYAPQLDLSTEGGTLLLVLVALGLTVVILGVAAASHFLQSRSRRDGPRSKRG